jgi:predicted nucleic acid-binding protein
VILVDTSALIEYLRATGTPVHLEVRRLIEDDRVLTTDSVVMEVLAGGKDESHASRLRAFMLRFEHVPVDPVDFEQAAAIYRTCRRAGVTIRSLTDCLIAAVAIRSGGSVLHDDRDFVAISSCTPLRLHQPR